MLRLAKYLYHITNFRAFHAFVKLKNHYGCENGWGSYYFTFDCILSMCDYNVYINIIIFS